LCPGGFSGFFSFFFFFSNPICVRAIGFFTALPPGGGFPPRPPSGPEGGLAKKGGAGGGFRSASWPKGGLGGNLPPNPTHPPRALCFPTKGGGGFSFWAPGGGGGADPKKGFFFPGALFGGEGPPVSGPRRGPTRIQGGSARAIFGGGRGGFFNFFSGFFFFFNGLSRGLTKDRTPRKGGWGFPPKVGGPPGGAHIFFFFFPRCQPGPGPPQGYRETLGTGRPPPPGPEFSVHRFPLSGKKKKSLGEEKKTQKNFCAGGAGGQKQTRGGRGETPGPKGGRSNFGEVKKAPFSATGHMPFFPSFRGFRGGVGGKNLPRGYFPPGPNREKNTKKKFPWGGPLRGTLGFFVRRNCRGGADVFRTTRRGGGGFPRGGRGGGSGRTTLAGGRGEKNKKKTKKTRKRGGARDPGPQGAVFSVSTGGGGGGGGAFGRCIYTKTRRRWAEKGLSPPPPGARDPRGLRFTKKAPGPSGGAHPRAGEGRPGWWEAGGGAFSCFPKRGGGGGEPGRGARVRFFGGAGGPPKKPAAKTRGKKKKAPCGLRALFPPKGRHFWFSLPGGPNVPLLVGGKKKGPTAFGWVGRAAGKGGPHFSHRRGNKPGDSKGGDGGGGGFQIFFPFLAGGFFWGTPPPPGGTPRPFTGPTRDGVSFLLQPTPKRALKPPPRGTNKKKSGRGCFGKRAGAEAGFSAGGSRTRAD